MDEERVEDVTLAVGELAANSLRHGGGSGVLRMWTDADHWIGEVAGRRLDNRPAGRASPGLRTQLSGRGLLMVNHLADLVRMHTTTEGTVVRAYFRV